MSSDADIARAMGQDVLQLGKDFASRRAVFGFPHQDREMGPFFPRPASQRQSFASRGGVRPSSAGKRIRDNIALAASNIGSNNIGVHGRGVGEYKNNAAVIYRPLSNRKSWLPTMRGWNETEIRAVDTSNTAIYFTNSPATTGTIVNLVQAGTHFNDRQSRTIALTKLEFTAWLTPGSSGAGEDFLRLLIVYDKQPNGAAAKWSDVIQAVPLGGPAGLSNNASDLYNVSNMDRFTILLDTAFEVPATGAASPVIGLDSTSSPTCNEMMVQKTIMLPKLITQFGADSSPAVTTDVTTGALLVMTQAESYNGQWLIYASTRVMFESL